MKRLILVLLSALIVLGLCGIVIPNDYSAVAPAQGAPAPESRDVIRTVIAEQFTATWCGFCPNAAGGLKKLQDEVGKENLVVLAYHVNDEMDSTQTNDRATDYGVSGIPDVHFDAKLRTTGAGSVDTAYADYKGHYDTRRGTQSPFQMESGGTISGSTASIEVNVDLVGSFSGNLNLRYVLYEDGVSAGGDTYNWVVREMKYDTVSSSDFPLSKQKSFTIDSAWTSSNLRAAIFLQEGTNSEIHQTAFEDFSGPLNEPPEIFNPKLEHTIQEDVEDKTLDLNTIFSDPEDDPMTFESAVGTLPKKALITTVTTRY